MSDLERRAAIELRAIVEHFAAREAEVVRAYFGTSHTMDEHVDVLLRQMGREIQTANWLNRAQRMLEDLEISVDRHEFAELLDQIADETQHYVLLADLAEWAAGRKLGRDDLCRYEVYARWDPMGRPEKLSNPLLPEANRMLEVGRALTASVRQFKGIVLGLDPRHVQSSSETVVLAEIGVGSRHYERAIF